MCCNLYEKCINSNKIGRTLNVFIYLFLVVKRRRFFNAFYIFYVYSIELEFDVDYRS